jgi:Ca-activated chloride channel family protein
MLTAGQLPPPDAVRIEEMVNYFAYDYAPPTGEHPFAVHLEEAACPWAEGRRLVRIGLKGREIDRQRRPACNLVFLIDVSGSMSPANKLPLLKQAMSLLTNQLTGEDRVGIVVYAGESGVALDSTPAGDRAAILNAIEQMESGGSTNGGAGIDAAYGIATSHFIEGGVNRVILATDGDFNVGVTERGELIRLIKEKAKSGVFLSVLGFGMGNLKDATLEQLADTGNGHYAYIDTFREAKKVLVDDIAATLVPIAKDVKIQIEFNPSQVASYRLIGYENRVMAARDFNDDAKDAGEIGAGHTVTALYEIVPAAMGLAGVDPLKYQAAVAAAKNDSATVTNDTAPSDELLTVKLRYKLPHGDVSTLIEAPLSASERGFESASGDLRLAASVAGFGMLLRCSPHKGDLTIDSVIQMAVGALGADSDGRRAELVDLMRRAKSLRGN